VASCEGSGVPSWTLSDLPPVASGRGGARSGSLVGTESRLDDELADQRADDREEERRGDDEVVVHREVHLVGVGRVDGLGRLDRQLTQHDIGPREQQVGAEPGRHSRERGRETGDRVTPDGDEEDRGERGQDDVARVRGDAGHDSGEHDAEGDEGARDRQDEPAQQHADEPSLFGDADADHRGEYDAQRRELHEVRDHAREQVLDALGREQIVHLEDTLTLDR